MSYATQDDLVRLYGSAELLQLTDRADPPAGEIDSDVVAGALADAEAEINSYIAVRVTTPVDPVPALLTGKVCAVARYLLWKDRASDKVKNDRDEAVAWAQLVGAGKASLGNAGATPTAPVSEGAPQVVARRRKFAGDF